MATKKSMPARGQRTATNKAKTVVPAILGSGYNAAQEKKWRAQEDLRTLQRAAEIKNDASRVKAAQAEAQQQMKALSTVVKK